MCVKVESVVSLVERVMVNKLVCDIGVRGWGVGGSRWLKVCAIDYF